jgi:hypothetical protein
VITDTVFRISFFCFSASARSFLHPKEMSEGRSLLLLQHVPTRYTSLPHSQRLQSLLHIIVKQVLTGDNSE